ncbi:peptidase M23, partial [Coprococcus comes]
MAEQRMKVRDKKVQKMTKDGLVEENLTDKSSVRVSNRASDVQMGGKQGEKELSLVDKSSRQSERSGKNIRPSVQKSRDAPELIRTEKQSEDFGQNRKQQNRKRIRAEVGKESRLAEKYESGQLGRLKEKRADLSENRGDSRRNQTGGSKKPKQKQRLKFAYEETGASVKNDKDMEKLNQMDTDGFNFRHQKQKEKAKKFSYEEARKKKEAKQHSKKAQVYWANEGETPGKKKSRLKFGEGESVKTEKASVVKKAGSATSAALHREISKNEDDNAAVEGAHKLEEGGESIYRLEQRSARRRKQRASRKRSRLERQKEKQTQAAARQEQKKLKKQIQKQQIKRDYAKAKRSEQTVGTATKGTIDYIKKIGGKVTN